MGGVFMLPQLNRWEQKSRPLLSGPYVKRSLLSQNPNLHGNTLRGECRRFSHSRNGVFTPHCCLCDWGVHPIYLFLHQTRIFGQVNPQLVKPAYKRRSVLSSYCLEGTTRFTGVAFPLFPTDKPPPRACRKSSTAKRRFAASH